MILKRIHIAGYRSIRRLWFEMGPVTVLVGPNGCGKTNIYNSLHLLARAIENKLTEAMASEGGMPSVLWAGDRVARQPVQVTLQVSFDLLEYELVLGLPPKEIQSAFPLDPVVKQETVTLVGGGRGVTLLDRNQRAVWIRDSEGRRTSYPQVVDATESLLSQIREPQLYPELSELREAIRGWRFYHAFRTDTDSPLRQPQVVFRTPVLHHDGRDLVAALLTILASENGSMLEQQIEAAFPGARLEFPGSQSRALFEVALQMPEFARPFEARELSDGTLRYLCLLAALLSPRPPALIAFNEPETSIHPELFGPLAAALATSAQRSQVLITTHSRELADEIARETGAEPIALEKTRGETRVVGHGLVRKIDDE